MFICYFFYFYRYLYVLLCIGVDRYRGVENFVKDYIVWIGGSIRIL